MKTDNTSNDRPCYEIKVKGHVDDQWQEWFDGLAIIRTDDGNTLLRGALIDQASLYGVLKKINNLGLILISVNPEL